MTGSGILLFLMYDVRKCLTLPVPLPYLKYKIMLDILITILVHSTDTIISIQFGITNGDVVSLSSSTLFTY